MLDKLRDPTNTKSSIKRFFYLVLFAAIILTFVFMTGTGSPVGGAAGGIAAVVNGEVITFRDFSSNFDRQESRMQSSLKDIPAAMRSMYESQYGTREQRAQRVLEQMIQNKLATQLAGDSGIFVSDKEVLTEIAKMDVFQEDGQFKASRYHQLLQANQLSPSTFEDNIRGDIAYSRFQRVFFSSVKATSKDAELDEYAQGQKINLEYLEVSQQALKKSVSITNEEVKSFKEKEKEKISKYYTDNKSDYTSLDKVAVSHILIKTKSESEADYKVALDKVTGIRKQITDTNFAELAKKHSEDKGSQVKGGSLGEVDKNVSFVAPFKKAVFELEVGELSQPVKTRFGYHIIKVTGKSKGGVKPLAEVETEISKKFITETKVSEDMAKLSDGDKGPSVEQVEALKKKYNIKWQDTGKFSLAQNQVPRIGDSSKVWSSVSKALSTKKMQMVDNNGKYYLLKLKDSVFEADKTTKVDERISRLSSERTSAAVQSWIDSKKSSASIKRNLKVSNF